MIKKENKPTIKRKLHHCRWIRHFTFVICMLCFYAQNIYAQTIPANFFGINYWMPYQYLNSGTGIPGGAVNYPNVETLVQQGGISLYRIGGNGYDKYGTAIGTDTTNNDYILAIKKVKNVNSSAKFLVQVPFASAGFTFTAVNAKTLVTNVKIAYPGTTIYYSIGNEWDLYRHPPGSKKYFAYEIANKIKDYSVQMKTADSTIRIVAPALSYFAAVDSLGHPILDSLIGGTDDITGKVPGHTYYYVDAVDFHTYAGGNYGDMSGINSGNYATYRSNSIAYPNGGFTTDLDSLQTLLSTANTAHSRTGANALTYAITEMNIDWKNPPTPIEGDELTNSTIGLGPRSFFAGQYFADMFSAILKNGTNTGNAQVEFVNPWSIHEHGGDGLSDGNGSDLGMTKGTASSSITPTSLSTYWHYQLLAKNFTGTYFPNNYGSTGTNYKALACSTATEIRVLIMNQNEQSPRGADNSTNTFKINFNNVDPSSADMLFKFATGNTAIGTSGTYSCTIQKETSMYLAFNKSTGALTANEVYSLQDALRPNDVGPGTWGGSTATTSTQTLYNNHNSNNVYTDIDIGTGTSITASSNKVFQFTNSTTITGPFSSGSVGTTLSIIPTTEVTCH